MHVDALAPQLLERARAELVVAERREERRRSRRAARAAPRRPRRRPRPPPRSRSRATISPGRGTRSTRANSTHSTWPTTATRTRAVSHFGAPRVSCSMMEAMTSPAVRALLRGAPRRRARPTCAGCSGRRPAEDAFQETFLRALRAYPRLRARRAPARLGADDRDATSRSTTAATRATACRASPTSRPSTSRPRYEELAQLTDGLPPTERAAVVLRYGYDLSYDADRRRARLVRGRGAPGRLAGVRRLRREGDLDERSRRPRPPLPRRRRPRGAASTSAYDLADSPVGDAARRRHRPRALPDLLRPARAASSTSSRGASARACSASRRGRRRARASSTSTSTGGARASTSSSTCARPHVRARRAARARPRPVRRRRRPTARSPRRSATRAPPARSAR